MLGQQPVALLGLVLQVRAVELDRAQIGDVGGDLTDRRRAPVRAEDREADVGVGTHLAARQGDDNIALGRAPSSSTRLRLSGSAAQTGIDPAEENFGMAADDPGEFAVDRQQPALRDRAR